MDIGLVPAVSPVANTLGGQGWHQAGAGGGAYAARGHRPGAGTPLDPSRTSAIVAGVCLLGLLVTVTLLPEPKNISLEELTEPGPGHAPMTRAAPSRRAALPRSPAEP